MLCIANLNQPEVKWNYNDYSINKIENKGNIREMRQVKNKYGDDRFKPSHIHINNHTLRQWLKHPN